MLLAVFFLADVGRGKNVLGRRVKSQVTLIIFFFFLLIVIDMTSNNNQNLYEWAGEIMQIPTVPFNSILFFPKVIKIGRGK